MAVFSCNACGFMFESLVSNNYQRQLLCRMEHCVRCDGVRYFRFVSHSGMFGRLPRRPTGIPAPSPATLWWRKVREGKRASAPLDRVCLRSEW